MQDGHGFLHRIQQARQALVVELVLVRHQDQFVIERHAVIFRIEGAAGFAGDVHLVQLEIAEGADGAVHLAGEDRGREREIHVHQRHVLQGQAVLSQHGLEQRILEAADRIADGFAFQVGHRFHRPVAQHHQRIQRRGDQGANAAQRQALRHLHMQLRLIRDRHIGLAGGHQLGWIVRIGRRDQLDLQAVALEDAGVFRHHQRRMVGIDEPVQHHDQLVIGGCKAGYQYGHQAEQGGKGNLSERHLELLHFRTWVSACQGSRRRERWSTAA